MSDYRLQIIHVKKPLEPVTGWQPGDKVETDLVDDFCARLKGKTGVGTTEAKLMSVVRAAWNALLLDLKGRV